MMSSEWPSLYCILGAEGERRSLVAVSLCEEWVESGGGGPDDDGSLVVCQLGAGGDSVGLIRACQRQETGLVPYAFLMSTIRSAQPVNGEDAPPIWSARALEGSWRKSHTETVPFSPVVQTTESVALYTFAAVRFPWSTLIVRTGP